jgi:hypothetical protein
LPKSNPQGKATQEIFRLRDPPIETGGQTGERPVDRRDVPIEFFKLAKCKKTFACPQFTNQVIVAAGDKDVMLFSPAVGREHFCLQVGIRQMIGECHAASK